MTTNAPRPNTTAAVGQVLGIVAASLMVLGTLTLFVGFLWVGWYPALFFLGVFLDPAVLIGLVGIVVSSVGLARVRVAGRRPAAAIGLALSILAVVIPVAELLLLTVVTSGAPLLP